FTVALPMRLPLGASTPLSNTAAPQPRLTGTKVLVVDDEADVQELLSVLLEELGAEVVSASSSQEALAIVEHFRPTVIISDIGMPDEDGYDFLATVRSRADDNLRKIPAIALTAYAHEADRQRAFSAGFQDHITKPFEPDEVARVLTALLRSSRDR
ncbi:MAG: response regulator, partial [Cyanobacteria bacterium J06638_6]